MQVKKDVEEEMGQTFSTYTATTFLRRNAHYTIRVWELHVKCYRISFSVNIFLQVNIGDGEFIDVYIDGVLLSDVEKKLATDPMELR